MNETNPEAKKSNPFGMLTQPRQSRTAFASTNQKSSENFTKLPPPKVPPKLPAKTPNQNSNDNKPKNGLLSGLFGFIRFLLAILILLILVVSAAFVYSLWQPESQVAKSGKWFIKNSFLNSYIDLPEDNNTDNTQSSSSQDSTSSQKLINNILGDPKQDDESFQFALPTTAKTTTQVVEDALPSVLSLTLQPSTKKGLTTQYISAGTGFIVSNDGLVVTNKHVIASACQLGTNKVQITALGYDQQAYNLKLLSADPVDDIAILKIENPPTNLKKISFANSNELKLGQEVIAIGNALGQLQNTVTKGIVSGLNRSFSTEITDECSKGKFYPDGLIQTDAAINKGNSGGPLFNASGQLIGMNTLTTKDAQNIGLAIPSSSILTSLNSFQKNNRIVRSRLVDTATESLNALTKLQNPWLPVEYGEFVGTLTQSISESVDISASSPAQQSGIDAGDIILEINGEKLISNYNNPSPLRRAILSKQAGDSVELTILKVVKRSPDKLEYATNPTKVQAKLGGLVFDLLTNRVISL